MLNLGKHTISVRKDGFRPIEQGLDVKITGGVHSGCLRVQAGVKTDIKSAKLFQGSVPKYQGLAGLVRKYYLFDAESRTGGGCYLWESREAAERVYNAEWRKMITERYGHPPEISFFETPVIVDNTLGKTILDAAE